MKFINYFQKPHFSKNSLTLIHFKTIKQLTASSTLLEFHLPSQNKRKLKYFTRVNESIMIREKRTFNKFKIIKVVRKQK